MPARAASSALVGPPLGCGHAALQKDPGAGLSLSGLASDVRGPSRQNLRTGGRDARLIRLAEKFPHFTCHAVERSVQVEIGKVIGTVPGERGSVARQSAGPLVGRIGEITEAFAQIFKQARGAVFHGAGLKGADDQRENHADTDGEED